MQLGFWERFQNFWGSILDEPELRVWQVQVDAVILHPYYSPNGKYFSYTTVTIVSTSATLYSPNGKYFSYTTAPMVSSLSTL